MSGEDNTENVGPPPAATGVAGDTVSASIPQSAPSTPDGLPIPPEIEPTRPTPTALECPDCFSHRAEILNTRPPRARCCDCGTAYKIKTVDPQPHEFNQLPDPDEPDEDTPPARRKRKASKQDLRTQLVEQAEDQGTLSIVPAPAKGMVTLELDTLIAGGPDSLAAAHRQAAKLSKQFGEEFEQKWMLSTPFLTQLALTHRARARTALVWRPRFLAAMALSNSKIMACRAAKVSHPTVQLHLKNDPEFAAQVEAAEAHAVQLLHDRAFQRALEGDCEPVLWQGIQVAHVRKFDSRLQIEMLRAYMPQRFKTPGQAPITINTGDTNVLVLGPEEREKIMQARRAHLAELPAAQEQEGQQ